MVNKEEIQTLGELESTTTTLDGATESRILMSGSLGSDDSEDYTLRLWMSEDVTIDDDAMNKTFASKVVVVVTVSDYSPCEEGYCILADAILANEYQTTPEN